MSGNALANEQKCIELTPNNYKTYISGENVKSIKNPFHENQCVAMSYKKNDSGELLAEDFDNNKEIKKYYDRFMSSDLTSVKMLFDPARNKVYSFFKFNLNDRDIKDFKKIAKRSALRSRVDEFLFLHELFHLNSDVTRDKSLPTEKKEMISDLASVIMISSKHSLDSSSMNKLMKGVRKVREKLSKNYSHGGWDKKGDSEHYDKNKFNKIIKAFEDLDSQELKVDSFSDALNVAKAFVLDEDKKEINTKKILARISMASPNKKSEDFEYN